MVFKLTRSVKSIDDDWYFFTSPGTSKKHDTISSANGVVHSADESFSACLLVMDDNHRLPEWLAYHYYALPLRHVVIAVDPASHQNPPTIPNKWHHLINITIWHDENYVPRNVTLKRVAQDNDETRQLKYLYRQQFLHYECSKYFRKLNKAWTSYHDIDEYLTISDDFFSPSNPRFSSQDEYAKSTSPIPNRTAFMSEPGYVLRLLQTYVKEQSNTFPVQQDLNEICIHIPRAKYGAIESSRNLTQRDVPFYINGDRLDTLRYRYRITRRFNDRDGYAKAIINLNRIPLDGMGSSGMVHRPLPEICSQKSVMRTYGSIPLGIQHYLGSRESYYFRDDANCNRRSWHDLEFLDAGGSDDEIRPWIRGFCDTVGPSLALELLKGAGIVTRKVNNSTKSINR
ncbi:hypothetical protein ACHAXS_008709 [Conticribra weissflogii]